jgi:hypothetical protein
MKDSHPDFWLMSWAIALRCVLANSCSERELTPPLHSRKYRWLHAPDLSPRSAAEPLTESAVVSGVVMPWHCPFVALSEHQRTAKGGKRRHKAKVENQ